MNNLKEKMRAGIESLIEMIDDSTSEKAFPADVYRIVEINGQTYQLHINCALRKCEA